MGTYRYSAEFRADAVALARSSGRPDSRIAAEATVYAQLLQTVSRGDNLTLEGPLRGAEELRRR
ncbi:hypothetical protein ACIA6T_32080 [Streptomyces sp. NPDC051740]|uniref:hypothetical protein n=1 Tax=Streptomyces sp. NPDC051740 TaxID=3365673 RepID=UPI00379DB4D5